MPSTISIADFVNVVKSNSSRWVPESFPTRRGFAWQEGYGAFSYGQSQIETVFNYIKNQEEHHKRETFREEYIQFLKKFNVPYKEEYLFEWIE